MSTQTYDIILLASSVAFIAFILFWSFSYGTGLVSAALLQSPYVIQQSIASYFSALCSVEGDALISYSISNPNSFEIEIKENSVGVVQLRDQAVPVSSKFGASQSSTFPNCSLNVKAKKLSLGPSIKFLEVEKKGNDVEVFVR